MGLVRVYGCPYPPPAAPGHVGICQRRHMPTQIVVCCQLPTGEAAAVNQKDLIDAAMEATGKHSLRTLAEHTGLDFGNLSKWRKDDREITLEAALILAKAAGLEPRHVAGLIVKPRTDSPQLRQLLKEWSKVAAALILTTIALPHSTNANESQKVYNDNLYTFDVYYVK